MQAECTVAPSSALVEPMWSRPKGTALGPWYLGPEYKFSDILCSGVSDHWGVWHIFPGIRIVVEKSLVAAVEDL